MTSPFANRLFRIAFVAAGIYNLAFGLWAALWPMAFFDVFEIERPRYPGIWACLGMVVGVYGLLYLHAAWRLETAWPVIAVGLLGKVLGPIGMVMSFNDDWPRRLGMLCVWNDLIWWLPFGLFLFRSTSVGRRFVELAPWICVALHSAGMVLMAIVLRPGTALEDDVAARANHIAEHASTWSLTWCVWMAAAASIVGFYAWWSSWLCVARQAIVDSRVQHVAVLAVVLAAAGMVCDFSGEGLLALVTVERAQSITRAPVPTSTVQVMLESLTHLERIATLLTAGVANGLYTLGGAALMFVTPGLPISIRAAMWGTWSAGAAMTISALAGSVWGVGIATAALFPLLVFWVGWMSLRWRPT